MALKPNSFKDNSFKEVVDKESGSCVLFPHCNLDMHIYILVYHYWALLMNSGNDEQRENTFPNMMKIWSTGSGGFLFHKMKTSMCQMM